MKYKGIINDVLPQNLGKEDFVNAMNIVLTENYNSITNENGNLFIADTEETIIGIIPYKEGFIFILRSPVGNRIALLWKDCIEYVLDVNNVIGDMGMTEQHPVFGVFRDNFDDTITIAITNNNQTPKIINIGKKGDLRLTDADDSNDIEMFPNISSPLYDDIKLNSGGALRTGAYQFAIRYKNEDNSTTSFLNISNPISVFNQLNNQPDQSSDKRITINISSLDTNFKYFDLAVIARLNGVYQCYLIPNLPIQGVNQVVSVDTIEGLENLTLQQILIPNISYKTAKAITTLDNRIFLGNLTKEEGINYQPWANNIKLFAKVTHETVPRNPRNPLTGFMPGEVYAFYIAFLMKDGTWSQAFHIPGRQASEYTSNNFENRRFQNTDQFFEPKWKLLDSAENTGNGNYKLGFWENENEFYPINFPSLGGQKVRHHRMPALHQIQSADSGITTLPSLSLEVDNVFIPEFIKDKVQGWKIFYAERNFGNSTILGYDSLEFMSTGTDIDISSSTAEGKDGLIVQSSGGNWNQDVENASNRKEWLSVLGDHNPEGGASNLNLIRSHCFDLLLSKPELEGVYFVPEMFIQYVNNFSDNVNSTASGSMTASLIASKYNLGFLAGANAWYALSSKYIPNNVIFSDAIVYEFLLEFDFSVIPPVPLNPPIPIFWNVNYMYHNLGGEEHIFFYLGNDSLLSSATQLKEYVSLTTPALTYDSIETNGDGLRLIAKNTNVTERRPTYSIRRLLSNAYNNFYSQKLVATDTLVKNLELSNVQFIRGGDCKNSFYSWNNVFNPNGTTQYYLNVREGRERRTAAFKWALVPTAGNANLRYEEIELSSKYWPKTNYSSQRRFWESWNDAVNLIKYAGDHSIINNLNSPIVFTSFFKEDTSFPNRIARSNLQASEGQALSWKTWAANDYYDMPQDKGAIINMINFNENLLIHTELSLFKSKTKTDLQTDIGIVTIGSGDLFQVVPTEILTNNNEGYAGTQHQAACHISKYGYTFVNEANGKIFNYNGDLNEISNTGLFTFFREHIPQKKWRQELILDNLIRPTEIKQEGSRWCHVIPKYLDKWDEFDIECERRKRRYLTTPFVRFRPISVSENVVIEERISEGFDERIVATECGNVTVETREVSSGTVYSNSFSTESGFTEFNVEQTLVGSGNYEVTISFTTSSLGFFEAGVTGTFSAFFTESGIETTTFTTSDLNITINILSPEGESATIDIEILDLGNPGGTEYRYVFPNGSFGPWTSDVLTNTTACRYLPGDSSPTDWQIGASLPNITEYRCLPDGVWQSFNSCEPAGTLYRYAFRDGTFSEWTFDSLPEIQEYGCESQNGNIVWSLNPVCNFIYRFVDFKNCYDHYCLYLDSPNEELFIGMLRIQEIDFEVDNPFIGQGFTIGFDQERNRVLFTKNMKNIELLSNEIHPITDWSYYKGFINTNDTQFIERLSEDDIIVNNQFQIRRITFKQ